MLTRQRLTLFYLVKQMAFSGWSAGTYSEMRQGDVQFAALPIKKLCLISLHKWV